jgi:hypothetical protein
MEIAEGRPSCRREFLAVAGRPQRPHARRQPCNMSCFDMPNLPLTSQYGRTTTSLVLPRHKQHQPTSALHQATNVWADKIADTTTTTTGSSTQCFLRNSTRGSDDTLSTASRPHSTHFSPDTTPDGRTRLAKPWTPYTYWTQTGARKTTSATPCGPYYPTSSKICDEAAHVPL